MLHTPPRVVVYLEHDTTSAMRAHTHTHIPMGDALVRTLTASLITSSCASS